MKPRLYIIVNTLRCKHPATPRMREKMSPRALIGGVVEVIGPPVFDCGCCVSVMPTWFALDDPRGAAIRRDNLAPIGHDPDAVTEPEQREVEA